MSCAQWLMAPLQESHEADNTSQEANGGLDVGGAASEGGRARLSRGRGLGLGGLGRLLGLRRLRRLGGLGRLSGLSGLGRSGLSRLSRLRGSGLLRLRSRGGLLDGGSRGPSRRLSLVVEGHGLLIALSADSGLGESVGAGASDRDGPGLAARADSRRGHRAVGCHDGDGLGGGLRGVRGGVRGRRRRVGAGGAGRGPRLVLVPAIGRAVPVLGGSGPGLVVTVVTPVLTPASRGTSRLLGGLLAAGLHDTGKGRAGKSQESNRLDHFEEIEGFL